MVSFAIGVYIAESDDQLSFLMPSGFQIANSQKAEGRLDKRLKDEDLVVYEEEDATVEEPS